MKPNLRFLCLIFVFIQTATAFSDTLTNGLVAYYPFNGNGNDESGNGHNASTTGAILVSGLDGKPNSAFHMTNIDTQRIVADGIDVANSSFTVSFWYKKNFPRGAVADEVAGIRIGNESSPGKEVQIFLDYGIPFLFGFWGNELKLNGDAGNQQWNQLLCSFDKNTMTRKMYLGGSFITSDVAQFPFTGSGYFDIGSHTDISFDEVRIYNRALTGAEVKLLYNLEMPTSSGNSLSDGLLAYYPFNGNANDETGNGNNGIVSGLTLTADRFGKPASAYSFEKNGYIQLVNSNLLDGASAASISGWIKNRLSPNEQGFIIGAGDGRSGLDPFAVALYGGGLQQAIFTDVLYVNNGDFGDVVGFADADPSVTVPSDKWSFFVSQFSSAQLPQGPTTCQFFLNGVLVRETNYNHSFHTAFDPFNHTMTVEIGDLAAYGATAQFRGEIDDIRFYNRILTLEEIQKLHTEGMVLHRATATPQIVNGFLVGAAIVDGGYGYSEPPVVLVDDATGTGAVLTAQVENGVVVGFHVDNAGTGYSSAAKLRIASPPLTPTLSIAVSKVNVTLNVTLGRKYQLESTQDLKAWIPVGLPFVADNELIVQEFSVTETGQLFRIREVL